MDFGMTYTAAQQEFRLAVRQWMTENVPPDISIRPASEAESFQLYQRRRELGRRLGAKNPVAAAMRLGSH